VAAQDPTRIVATVGGKPLTARQALDLLKPLPPQERKRFEANLQGLVQQIYMEDQLADEATKLSLDQQSPWKEQLRMARANILTQAYLSKVANSANATPGALSDDPKQYYDSHPNDFDQVKLSGIFIAFSPPGTPASGNAAVCAPPPLPFVPSPSPGTLFPSPSPGAKNKFVSSPCCFVYKS